MGIQSQIQKRLQSYTANSIITYVLDNNKESGSTRIMKRDVGPYSENYLSHIELIFRQNWNIELL